MQLLGSASLMKGRYYILFTGRREEGGSGSARPHPVVFFLLSLSLFATASIHTAGGPARFWLSVRLAEFGKAGSRWREKASDANWKAVGNLGGRSVTLHQGRRACRASGVGGVDDFARNRSPSCPSPPPVS